MYLPPNIFWYFLNSLAKLNNFCVIECTNYKVTNVLWMSKVKELCKKHRKRMRDSFLQFFWNINCRPLSSSNLIFSSILIHFDWFKISWVHQLFQLIYMCIIHVLNVWHLCIKCTNPWKKQFSHDFSNKIMGWEVCDV